MAPLALAVYFFSFLGYSRVLQRGGRALQVKKIYHRTDFCSHRKLTCNNIIPEVDFSWKCTFQVTFWLRRAAQGHSLSTSGSRRTFKGASSSRERTGTHLFPRRAEAQNRWRLLVAKGALQGARNTIGLDSPFTRNLWQQQERRFLEGNPAPSVLNRSRGAAAPTRHFLKQAGALEGAVNIYRTRLTFYKRFLAAERGGCPRPVPCRR